MQKKFQHIQRRMQRQQKQQIKRLRRLRRHPILIPALVFVGLCVLAAGAFLLFNHHTPKFKPISSYIVTVSYDHQKQVVPTNEPTVGALLDKMHVKLAAHDRVEPDVKTPIKQDNLLVNIYRAVPVEVIDSGRTTFALSAATTSRSLVEQVGVQLYPEDLAQTQPLPTSIISGGIRKTIVITRSTPVLLNIYGTPALVRTQAKTVSQLLTEKGIKLENGDRVQPAADSPLTPNMQVYLLHKGVEVVTEFQEIPMPVQIVRDNSLSFGTSAIRQQGSPGQQATTYQIVKKDGKEVGRTLLHQVIIVQPVTQIIAQGQAVSIPADKQAVMAQAGISSGDYPYVDYIVSHESGWCPTKLQGQYGYCPGYAPPSFPPYLGYGLVQATPGTKMASAGSDWSTNPVTQLRWATGYAVGRYGSWGGAYDHWQRYHNW